MIKQTVHYLETGEMLPQVTPREKLETAKLHLNRLTDLKGETVAVKEFRSIAFLLPERNSSCFKNESHVVTSASKTTRSYRLIRSIYF